MYKAGHKDLKRLKGILKRLPRDRFHPIARLRTFITGVRVEESHFSAPGIELAADICFSSENGYRGRILIGRQDGSLGTVTVNGVFQSDGMLKECRREEECDPGEWNIPAICDSFGRKTAAA